jgi:hypothetical protein
MAAPDNAQAALNREQNKTEIDPPQKFRQRVPPKPEHWKNKIAMKRDRTFLP